MHGIRRLVSLSAVAFPLTFASAKLQAQYEGCVDARGVPVYSQVAPNLQDVAMAALVPPPNGTPVIYYNPYVLSQFSQVTRIWWYMHECGHHALGHAFRNIPLTQEQEADCFATVTLVQRGIFGPAQVQQVQYELAQIGPGDWQHLPGPARAINLIWCLRNAGIALLDEIQLPSRAAER